MSAPQTPAGLFTEPSYLSQTERDESDSGASEMSTSPHAGNGHADGQATFPVPQIFEPHQPSASFKWDMAPHQSSASFKWDMARASYMLRTGEDPDEPMLNHTFPPTGVPDVLSIEMFKAIAKGSFFAIPGSPERVHAVMAGGDPSQDWQGPKVLYSTKYTGAWVFSSGEPVSQGVIPDSTVAVCRPEWLMDDTLERLKRHTGVSVCLILKSKVLDGRITYMRTPGDSVYFALIEMILQASRGVSTVQTIIRATPMDGSLGLPAQQFCLDERMRVTFEDEGPNFFAC